MERSSGLCAAGVLVLAIGWVVGATAHYTAVGATKSFGVGGAANPDPCRRTSSNDIGLDGCNSPARTGLSGSYGGSAGAIVFRSPMPLGNPRIEVCDDPEVRLDESPCAERHSLALLTPTTLFPYGGVSAGLMQCDFEVQGDGSDADDQQATDELVVDAWSNNSPLTHYPDGTVDDGGVGGACHVKRSDYRYELLGYKTSGCAGRVAATDWAVGGHGWYGVGCSVISYGLASPGLSTCIVNAASFGPSSAAARGKDCIDSFVRPPGTILQRICFQEPPADTMLNFGEGTGRGGAGIPLPPLPPVDCVVVDSSTVAYAFSSVSVESGRLTPLTGGWIDQV